MNNALCSAEAIIMVLLVARVGYTLKCNMTFKYLNIKLIIFQCLVTKCVNIVFTNFIKVRSLSWKNNFSPVLNIFSVMFTMAFDLQIYRCVIFKMSI